MLLSLCTLAYGNLTQNAHLHSVIETHARLGSYARLKCIQLVPFSGAEIQPTALVLSTGVVTRKPKPFHDVQVRSILGDAPCLSDCRQLGEAMPAVFSPGTSVTILGQGKQGAVVFHPNSLAYSVRLGEFDSRVAVQPVHCNSICPSDGAGNARVAWQGFACWGCIQC